jgi:hypothetical protein
VSDDGEPLTLTFRCPKPLEGLLPAPSPAAQGLPGWLRAMPARAYSAVVMGDDDTVKRCPPFLDAMTCGFLIPLICDLRVADGEIVWDSELPAGDAPAWPRSPLSFHDASQVAGTPLFEDDRVLVKFHNLWTIEAPPGWSLLFMHPVNRFDLPFTTLTGLVDCDSYHDAWIHFPARWNDPGFRGVLPAGTPVAQCVPIRRERWQARTTTLSDAEAERTTALLDEIALKGGVYRRDYRA